MQDNNIIIAIEGINGIGKSTLIDILKKRHNDWIFFKYPINKNLKKGKDFIKEMNDNYYKNIQPLQNKIIIYDRYDLSTKIYNNYHKKGAIAPNFYIILTCEKSKLKDIKKRLILRNRKNFDIELKNLEKNWYKYEEFRNQKNCIFFDISKIEEVEQWIINKHQQLQKGK